MEEEIADDIYGELAIERDSISQPVRLGIVIGEANPVIASFVRIKSRAAERLNIEIVGIDLMADSSLDQIRQTIEHLAKETEGIIVQLPLPEGLDANLILSMIPSTHDVDGINPDISEDRRLVRAPVAEAICEVLKRNAVAIEGKHIVVVGEGRLVGSPTASLLQSLGGNVSIVTLEKGSLEELKNADIVVLGAGNPGFIKPDMLKPGVVLIDAGTSESNGRITGDADPACAEVASVFTPVPGGIGPIAVAMIFKNLLALIKKNAPHR
jgi:methylenetetrahydrofolate dehydrogenase (NADP+)/methenyltetrahydrofolate cyclohydrolase